MKKAWVMVGVVTMVIAVIMGWGGAPTAHWPKLLLTWYLSLSLSRILSKRPSPITGLT